jgi:hypothetical protein
MREALCPPLPKLKRKWHGIIQRRERGDVVEYRVQVAVP